MPEADFDLTTAAAVRDLLQDEDSIPDGTLQTMITAASRSIIDHCRREFAPATTAAETRNFLARGSFLDLAPYDLRGEPESVTLFADLAEGDQVVLEAGQYRVRPIPAPNGVKQWLELHGRRDGEVCEVAVEGQWGFAQVPEDVAYWCGITVLIWSRNDISAFSTAYSVDEGRLQKPEALPAAVRYGLRGYERKSIG